MIKIWSHDTLSVIADIVLNNTLTSASFLNHSADIVFGFLNNLYSVEFVKCKYCRPLIHSKSNVKSLLIKNVLYKTVYLQKFSRCSS